MSRATLSVSLPADAARARYALGVLLQLLGFSTRDAGDGEQPDLVYGPGPGRCCVPAGSQSGWDDPHPAVARLDGLAALHRPDSPPVEGAIGFDLLYAAYACLTAPWERDDPVDEVGCPIAALGWLARNDLLREPLVHRYAARLGDALRAAGIPVPPPAASVVVLTHDVDNNWSHLFARRESLALLRHDLRNRRPTAIRRAAGLGRRSLRPVRSDPNDRFGEWTSWHAGWSSRPAYFAASHGLFESGADRRDVPYDVRHPAVRETLRAAREAGAEIGVHFSIEAARSVARLRLERTRLEEVVGAPVRTSRHHWWALGVPAERTLRMHAEAGIELDCSLGFNDRAGFRRGIATAFHSYDPERGTAARVWSLPTIAMDAAVAGEGRSVDESLEELRSLHAIVEPLGGALVLDWHVHAANPAVSGLALDALRRFLDEATAAGTRLCTPLEAADVV